MTLLGRSLGTAGARDDPAGSLLLILPLYYHNLVGSFLFIIFGLLVLGLALWAVSNIIAILGGSPPVHTGLATSHEIIKSIALTPKSTLMDLGSGTGNLLIAARKQYNTNTVGYELSPFPYLVSRLRTLFSHGKVKIHYASVFEADLGQATHIFIYLLPKMLLTLLPKIKKEARVGTKIITRGFPLPDWQPIKKLTVGREKTNIFIYQVK